jgi:SHAQKYF class myb-like DNA-binding protein
MPLAEVANSLNMEQGPSTTKVQARTEVLRSSSPSPTHESSTPDDEDLDASVDRPCKSSETEASSSTPSAAKPDTDNSIANDIPKDPRSKITGDFDSSNQGRDDQTTSARVLRVSLSSSVNSAVEDVKMPRDNNDAVAEIAVAAAASGIGAVVADAAAMSSSHATKAQPQSRPQEGPPNQQSPTKETAIHTRDIKMTDDDTLLGDVPWTMEQHKQFVAAIFEVGLKTCSPSVIMENMRKKPKYVTRERTKSHLQKYRITKDRNKDDFLMEYEMLLKKTEAIKNEQVQKLGRTPIPKAILSKALDGKKATKLIGGQAAALLSFSVLNNCSTDHGPDQIPFQGTKTTFPKLTEEEQQTSLGASLLYIKGLLHNMTDVLLKERHGLSISAINHAVKDYDSASSSEDEDYSDFEDEDSRQTTLSADPHQRKPSPETALTSQHPHNPGTMSHTGSYGYSGAFPGGHIGSYPQSFPQGPAAFPQFPPYGFGGPGTARPFAPYPPHVPAFSQSSYPPAAPPPMNNPYQQGPPNMPSFAGAADSHPYPQGHGDYYHYGNEHFPQSTSSPHPYPDDPNRAVAYSDSADHQLKKEATASISKLSKADKTSSRDTSRPTSKEGDSRSRSAAISHDYSGRSHRKWTDLDSKEKLALDNLFASPLVADKKRRRKHETRPSKDTLDVTTELDEDRGIPGASKVASPFHREAEPSPITSNAKRRRIRRPHREQVKPTTPPAAERASQESLFMESSFDDVFEAIQTEQHKASRSRFLNQAKTTPKSKVRPGTDTSPDWMLTEAHLSPGDMSVASKLSHDGHQLVWEPLAIDMNEHLLDQSRPSLSTGETYVSPNQVTRAAFDHSSNPSHNDSPDASSSSKRSFFRDTKDPRK